MKKLKIKPPVPEKVVTAPPALPEKKLPQKQEVQQQQQQSDSSSSSGSSSSGSDSSSGSNSGSSSSSSGSDSEEEEENQPTKQSGYPAINIIHGAESTSESVKQFALQHISQPQQNREEDLENDLRMSSSEAESEA